MVHKVFSMAKHLQSKLGSRFLKTHLLENLTEDVIDDENSYLPSEDIFLGLVTRNLLQKKLKMVICQKDSVIRFLKQL